MNISDAITLILCILGIAYTSLYLYFDYRVQVRQKEFEKRVDNPISYRIGKSSINLPSGHNLKSSQIEYIAGVINSITIG